ncbi:LuxR C-terminal-related transcriptional regulator [Nonomuraea sediminis]|uniref:LuxR C-terminal-related transcriptional regulator n=1 Tax=Nonomuraea sediminis TaxID=2835864 RepID=UPI001BDD321C|nr:LuxR family transcriptional regulator [Nonomuraea sediminis]
MSDQGSGWPFAGRDVPLAAVRGALESGPGVMIAGAAGVGKSRLAAEAVRGLRGRTLVRALGTETAAVIPFGAFAHVLTGPPDSGENPMRWAARSIAGQAGRGRLLVSVDDAHRLDPAAAALVHHLADSGTAQVLVTVRSGEPLPAPIAALWKDELLERIELAPLTRDQVGLVLAGALGGEVTAETVRHLARVSEGNVLYLREIVHAGRTAGSLRQVEGRWCWRGELSVTTRLRELVGDRIGHLEQDEREVLELVSFGEPVGTDLLVSLTSGGAVERVEDRGLIVTVADDGREHVRLGHPLYGEVVRDGCGTLRTRRRLRMLAEALEATGLRRREDVLRAAVWRLDSGSVAAPEMLLSAANLAWARQDPRLAARLGKAAQEAGAGVAAVALVGEVLTVLGDGDEALTALRQAARNAVTEDEVAQHALSVGVALAWAGSDAEACRALELAAGTLTDPAWQQEVFIYRGVVDIFFGRLTGAARWLARARDRGPMTARGAAHAAGLEAWMAAYAGRTARSLAVARDVLTGVDDWRDEAPHALPTLLDAQCAAQVFAGRLEDAARTAEEGMELATGELSVSGFGAYRAMVSRLRGQADEARRWSREDAARLPARTPYLGRCLAELAHACALLGRTDEARATLAEAERLAARWSFTCQPVLQARVWLRAALGDLDAAVSEAIAAADLAEKHEHLGWSMFALHDLVRLGSAPLAADRLEALAGRLDGQLVRPMAAHARAAELADPVGLRAAAVEFERLGLVLYAAEATAQEAAAYLATGRGALARGAQTRAWALARSCPGVTTPALVELATPELTPRQREIVQLAAAGLTNRQIADRLTVSTRTAANHLQAVYDKLGVNDRTEVGRLLTSL